VIALVVPLVLVSGRAAADQARGAQNQLSSPADDAERMGRLTKTGVRVDGDQVRVWTSAGALSADETKQLVQRLELGVRALQVFLHTPRRWQDSRPRPVDYYFEDGPFFVPHATVNRQVLLPVSRLRDGKAPLLHETTHALLTAPQGRRPLAWLTEGLAAYAAKAVSAEQKIPEGDTFELGDVGELDAKCAAGLSTPQGPTIAPFIGAPGNLATLYAMEPAFQVRQVFYGCSASFTKYLVDRFGIERVVDLLPEDDPHKKLEELAGAKMTELRSAWATKIGAKGPAPLREEGFARLR